MSYTLFEKRIALVQAFLRAQGHDGVLLSRVDNFAMATGGRRNYINLFTDMGACSLFVPREGRPAFVGNTIESPRMMEEELADCGCGAHDFLWFEGSAAQTAGRVFSGALVSDDGSLGANVHGELAVLRASLTGEELEKYRALGRLASESMMATLNAIEQGMPEVDIAARLVSEGLKRRCHVPVALIAADERIARYRHPLPTVQALTDNGGVGERCVRRYVMVVGCFMREGLVVSLTRFRQVDELAPEIHASFGRICAVDALMQEATESGRTLGDVFSVAQQAYADLGFAPDEWHNHHQGGATGYAGRTAKGQPGAAFRVLDPDLGQAAEAILGEPLPLGRAFAWNPSAPGVKSEDTFILFPDGRKEIVTETPQLPSVDLASVLGRPIDVVKSAIAPG